MPDAKPVSTFAYAGAVQRQVPPAAFAGAGSVGPAKSALLPRTIAPTMLRPQPPKSAPTSAMVAAAGVGGGPSAELRQIALFIAKFKLEATKTKLLLARLTPPRRRWVMGNFTPSSSGTGATVQLEQFIAQCERSNSWDAASAGASAMPGGLKRSFASSGIALDPNKRPRVGSIAAYGSASSTYRPPVQSAYRPPVARSTPAWLSGASAAGVGRIPLAKAPMVRTYGGAVGYKPGIPKAAGVMQHRPVGYGASRPGLAPRPAAPYSGTIKPVVAKAKAKPGSLIANLLRM